MKESIRDFFKIIVNSYIGGIALIVLGLLAIWLVIKGPDMSKSSFREDIKGWAGGLMLILIGIGVIIAKLIN
ncbi:MAG: hypothetical protein V4658_09595 [Bacteroidota bacterium]